MEAPLRPTLAFNDHLSMSMRIFDTAIEERLFEYNPDFALADLNDPDLLRLQHRKRAMRSGLDPEP